MQCSYDARGNSVPTILLLIQMRLYEQGGLRAEGIFRINAENTQEEYVKDQLNNGVVPESVDVHCLAGFLPSTLVHAWFRELPTGLLDSLSSEQEEQINKMNARNIDTVFAPNMAQMVDPLTALMHAVQVMNFLMMLILKTLKERQDPTLDDASLSNADPSDENGHASPELHLESCRKEATEHVRRDSGSANGGCRLPREVPAMRLQRVDVVAKGWWRVEAAGDGYGH
ncbi:hypothetical protein ZIOFF_064590 [Zingiber officinale]|uniref:Rho-GAP domain-containing protein n=1 Tax=Zingiber officinale TaxID=94328 RepID=A0A8J5EW73_ZINOF|nr:hypothetical protein ZIOFF_064590 [Zingiber officinale]